MPWHNDTVTNQSTEEGVRFRQVVRNKEGVKKAKARGR